MLKLVLEKESDYAYSQVGHGMIMTCSLDDILSNILNNIPDTSDSLFLINDTDIMIDRIPYIISINGDKLNIHPSGILLSPEREHVSNYCFKLIHLASTMDIKVINIHTMIMNINYDFLVELSKLTIDAGIYLNVLFPKNKELPSIKDITLIESGERVNDNNLREYIEYMKNC